MKYAIITPTYINHFKFIKPYLKSYIKYVKDKDNIHLYFIISKAEKDKFNKITDRYKDQCNITVLYFEELLGYFGVKELPENLLKKYGRFTFQTFKKLYALLFIPEEKSLVLDSESMWVRKTNMSELFEKFFSKPVIYGSLLDKKLRIGPAFNQMVKNVDFLLKKTCPYWFLENYM